MLAFLNRLLGKTPETYDAVVSRLSQWAPLQKKWLKLHPVCEVCGSKENLNVHHKHPVQYYPELELDENNLMTLCERPTINCHLNTGHLGDFKAWNPDVEKDVAIWKAKRLQRLYRRLESKGEVPI